MDVRIGIIQTVKELDIDLPEGTSHDDVVADVDKALAQPDGVLWLTDKRGRRGGRAVGQGRLRRDRRRRRGPARRLRDHLTLSSVPELLAHQLLFVTGKGGVGKTTVAAAIALLASEQGRRTLVCEVEPKGDLARAYECGPTPFSGRRITDDLVAMSMDTEAALREYLRTVGQGADRRAHRPGRPRVRLRGDGGAGDPGDPDGRQAVLRGSERPLRPRRGRRLLDRQRRRPARRAHRHQRADPRRRRSVPDRLDPRDPRRPRPDRGGARRRRRRRCPSPRRSTWPAAPRARRRFTSPASSPTGSCPSCSGGPRSRSSTSSSARPGSSCWPVSSMQLREVVEDVLEAARLAVTVRRDGAAHLERLRAGHPVGGAPCSTFRTCSVGRTDFGPSARSPTRSPRSC